MGDPKGFMKFSRAVPKARPVAERVRDWKEIYPLLPWEQVERQGARCMDCGVPFCQSNYGCPVQNQIPNWNDLVYQGRWKDALRMLHATNNFPEFTGRLCPAPCESACVLGIIRDPVAVRIIEWHIIDRGWSEGWVRPIPPERETGFRVAVVGSGPAGLAVAQQLRRMGHAVTVFEKADRIGGLLRYGIPDFKMEKWVLDRRLEQMREEGVVFQPGIEVGKDLSAWELLREFDALCLCGGAGQPRDLPVPGRELQGIHFAMEYLAQQNRINAGDPIPEAERIHARDRVVLVIGGGDTGSDCVGTAHRQGAREVHQWEILPRPPESRDPSTPWPLYPKILRTSHAHEEGCVREWAVMTQAFSGEGGQLRRVHAVRVQWEPGPDGRPRPVPIPGSEFTLDVDLVILAMGFVGPVREGLLTELGVSLDARGNVVVDEDHRTSVPRVFAAGDMKRGASLIVWAIREGREAAEGIDRCLRRGEVRRPTTVAVSSSEI